MSERLDALRRAFPAPVSGPTYRPFTRVTAAALVVMLFVWGGRVLLAEASAGTLDATRLGAAAAVALALLWPMPSLLFGRTVVDAEGVRQLGWMGRSVTWSEVMRVRFVRMPLSPRLMVSTGFGRVRVFYSGNRELDAAFGEAVRLLAAPSGAAVR